MNEIGSLLKETRETMGLTVKEVATDLELDETQIVNIESANQEELEDILNLREIITEYAKYLGLENETITDLFNEFVFSYTSKIPLAEIAKASAEKEKEEASFKKVVSPYTLEKKAGLPVVKLLVMMIVIIIIIIIYFVMQEWLFN